MAFAVDSLNVAIRSKIASLALLSIFLITIGCGGGSTTTPQAVGISVTPTSASVQVSGTQTFTAAVTNTSNTAVTWQVNSVAGGDATHGTIDVTGRYTAPAVAPTPATVTVTAVATADTTKTAAAAVTILSGTVTVAISPVRVALTTGQAQTFSATVAGTAVTAVTWSVDSVAGGNTSVGTVTAAGVYTPPSTAGTHTITATSVADSTVSSTANIAVTDLKGMFTYHNDLSRDGVNAQEYALNTTSVKAATFGKRFSCTIDASAYAQPLWVANVTIGGGTHNVIIAATQHDTVYAFDADASPCHTYWSKSMLATGETWVSSTDVNSTDLVPDIGIVGTPVIDPSTNTIYLVAKSKTTTGSPSFIQRLHALSLIDGSEKFGGPQSIAFTSNSITFNALTQNQRPGLALVNGVVYVAWASHGDNPVYYGWLVGYNTSTLAQTAAFNDDPNAGFGGIWMSGGAPAADSSNNLYVITGNGNFDGTTQFGDSFLKLSSGNSIGVLSFFAPSDQGSLNSGDLDLGSGGAAILIDQPSGPVPHLIIGGGKEGTLYLLNRDALGGNTPTDSGAVQTFSAGGNRIFATPAFWQNTVYLGPITDHLKAFTFDPTKGTFTTAPASQSPGTTFAFPGTTPSVSSQGTSNGVVWTIEYVKSGAAVLHAYDATNLGTELWNSSTNSADQAGQAVKFTVPTIANGKVYVGTAGEISVYGLSPN